MRLTIILLWVFVMGIWLISRTQPETPTDFIPGWNSDETVFTLNSGKQSQVLCLGGIMYLENFGVLYKKRYGMKPEIIECKDQ